MPESGRGTAGASRKGNRRGAGSGPGAAGKAAAALPANPAAAGGSTASSAVAGAESQAEHQRQRREQQQILDDITAAEREGGYPAAYAVLERREYELPPKTVSRAHLELAERAKRGAGLQEVKFHLAQALKAQPRAAQVWLETARALEELGELEECRARLERALEMCSPADQICLRLVRVLERLGDMDALRKLVGTMRSEPLERMHKVMLEAVHAEVRAGNGETARLLLQSVLRRMPQQGPVYCEACRVEGILGHWPQALSTAELGVQTCPKYGPLWFTLLRHAEKVFGAKALKDYAHFAIQNICHELHWKIHFEVAAAYSREGALPECRQSIGKAAIACPKHLRWKIWLLAARAELWNGSARACRGLLAQARADAPVRMQVAVCIERARTEEFLGNLAGVRIAFGEAHNCEGHDWKVFLEHIFMEARQGCLAAAQETAQCALELHPATGRLWSALVALQHCGEGGARAGMVSFRKATQEVAKSGEVWCEGARIFLNPLGEFFDLGRANKCLEFAVHLTPQYGDSFLELLRLRFLMELQSWILSEPLIAGISGMFLEDFKNQDELLAVLALAMQKVSRRGTSELKHRRFMLTVNSTDWDSASQDQSLDQAEYSPQLALERLEVLCSYADPNYGFLWFWCRQSSLATPREVLQQMAEELRRDLLERGALKTYLWALLRWMLHMGDDLAKRLWEHMAKEQDEEREDEINHSEESLGSSATASSTARPAAAAAEADFALGAMRLSACMDNHAAPVRLEERRRLIFGSDILCS